MNRVMRFVLRWIQARCKHPDYAVKADILEGGWNAGAHGIQWCEICGAWRIVAPFSENRNMNEWRMPRPDYYER